MNLPLSISIKIDTCDADFTGTWHPGAIFRAMQSAGNIHSIQLGFSYDELRAQNLAWVLTRGQLQMEEYPRYGDEILLRTWPGVTKHSLYPRYYIVEKEGRVIGRASTMFVMMNLETRRIADSGSFVREMPLFEEKPPLPLPGNIPLLQEEATTSVYTPVYMDLDINRHVNNTRYIDWFMNQFSYEHHEKHALSRLLIHYTHELLPGRPVTLSVQRHEDVSQMRGFCEDTMCFALSGTWRERT